METYKRKQHLINKKFQIFFIIKFCGLLFVSAIFTIYVLFILSSSSTTVYFGNSRILIKNTAVYIMPLLIKTSIIVSITFGAIAVILFLLSSHKIAGPLFRLKREIEKISDGEIPKDFYIREKDQFQEVARSFDVMVKNLHLIISDLKQSWKDLKQDLSGSFDETSEQGKRIRDKVNSIDKKFQHFKT